MEDLAFKLKTYVVGVAACVAYMCLCVQLLPVTRKRRQICRDHIHAHTYTTYTYTYTLGSNDTGRCAGISLFWMFTQKWFSSAVHIYPGKSFLPITSLNKFFFSKPKVQEILEWVTKKLYENKKVASTVRKEMQSLVVVFSTEWCPVGRLPFWVMEWLFHCKKVVHSRII